MLAIYNKLFKLDRKGLEFTWNLFRLFSDSDWTLVNKSCKLDRIYSEFTWDIPSSLKSLKFHLEVEVQ